MSTQIHFTMQYVMKFINIIMEVFHNILTIVVEKVLNSGEKVKLNVYEWFNQVSESVINRGLNEWLSDT